MLNSFFVSNFRLFKRLELPQLSRVNLIVGKNGSGKSALLEAIRLYTSNAEAGVLNDLILSRQDFWEGQSRDYPRGLMINVLRHLFWGHNIPNYGQEGIELGMLKSEAPPLCIKKENIKKHESKYGQVVRDQAENTNDMALEQNEDQAAIVIREGDVLHLKIPLSGEISPIGRRIRLIDDKYVTQFVPAQKANIDQIASMWDATTLTILEDEVIKGIQLLVPGIRGLTFVENRNDRFQSESRLAIVRHDRAQEPLPLKNMGDGIYRLFHIILALANAKDGILLIDEFENGLHWKAHPKVWDVVFRLSEKLNVQVFATTHSGDCIRGFETVWRDHPDAGTFFRLDVKEENVKATYYNQETLSDALRLDVEVR